MGAASRPDAAPIERLRHPLPGGEIARRPRWEARLSEPPRAVQGGSTVIMDAEPGEEPLAAPQRPEGAAHNGVSPLAIFLFVFVPLIVGVGLVVLALFGGLGR